MRTICWATAEIWFPGLNAAHVDELDLEKALEVPLQDRIHSGCERRNALLYEAPKQRLSQS